jgi:SNF2 family DNA or RNA helicase
MEQLVSAIEGGHKILVFSQFVKTLAILRDELVKAGIPFCYLDGSTKDRLGECNRFNRTPSIPVFLISLMAGGTGLTLTGADMVIHYDPWWNPAVEDQATDRAHRIGQTKKVYVVKLIASDTIEEKVLALQRRKQAVIAATVATTDAAIVEKLTLDDLTELLA